MAIGDQNYQDERVGIPLTSLTLSHFFGCPQPGPGKTNIGNHCYSIDFLCQYNGKITQHLYTN